ncbi:potassium channel family protein [Nocardiopsis valliformis]|uniref:potassium channel family protein n=1 Tax=Nocardiopsis valliformis TaxID=239974 RepID=UPI00034573C9|nr:potassium channel family protein [Nocardiopsis valliformis]
MRGRPGLSRSLAWFLAAAVLLHFAYPLTLNGQVWALAYTLLYPLVAFLGLRVVLPPGKRLLPVAVFSVVFLASGFWAAFNPEAPMARLGLFSAIVLFQGYLILALLTFVFTYGQRHRSSHGPQLIMAAICVYLLLGGLFGALFGLMEALWPGGFENSLEPNAPVTWQDLNYLSFVTLVTLGYGDMVPLGAWARSLAVCEAVIGTLFLATVIARIVGAYVSPPGPEPDGGDPTKTDYPDSPGPGPPAGNG